MILFEVDESLKIGLYSAVMLLYFAIGLGIEGNRKSPLDPKKITSDNQNFEVNNEFLLVTIELDNL